MFIFFQHCFFVLLRFPVDFLEESRSSVVSTKEEILPSPILLDVHQFEAGLEELGHHRSKVVVDFAHQMTNEQSCKQICAVGYPKTEFQTD